jgi:alpha-glucosidase
LIRKYRFGKPLETGAVVKVVPESKDVFPIMRVQADAERVILSCRMAESDRIYGLGEQVRGINKRGFTYISHASDDGFHLENKNSLYGAHNFLIISSRKLGIFVDDPGRVVFDVGETHREQLVITAGPDCDIYAIEGDSLKDVAKQFRKLIGRSYIPPKWAFGYQQSRWGYRNETDIREVVRGHHDRGIPLDAVYMDIDYMERYKDFTVDTEKFPDFPEFVKEMKAQGIHLVPIIDAGVKMEEGYSAYEEGVRGNYFCKDVNGKDFVAAVWPGRVHLPDVLNTKARAWFGDQYRVLLEQGIDGFWNDMNEPALFYSEENLQDVLEEVSNMKGENLDIDSFFHLQGIVRGLANNSEDYKRFYHDMDGVRVRHDQVHNLFGFGMTRAAAEAFERMEPKKRILLFSRSSYIGMHRYGGIWTGDNHSWWGQLLLSIQQMPSLNMCGILYTGSDVGGFASNTTEDLMMRWLEFAIFTPLMRNHSANDTRRQEVYQFDRIEDFRNLIRIRYGLLPYLYSEYMKCVLEDEMYFRPLAFDYPEDEQAARVEDQLLVGDSLMIAPVYIQNAEGRYVYLPEEMLMVRMRSPEERTCEVLAAGHHYVEIALEEVVIFVKKGKLLPFAVPDEKLKTTADLKETDLEWIGFVEDAAEYVLYTDDGISRSCTPKEEWKKVRFTKEDFDGKYVVKI